MYPSVWSAEIAWMDGRNLRNGCVNAPLPHHHEDSFSMEPGSNINSEIETCAMIYDQLGTNQLIMATLLWLLQTEQCMLLDERYIIQQGLIKVLAQRIGVHAS